MYIRPTKSTKIEELKIPRCRGIVIESSYQAKPKGYDNELYLKEEPWQPVKFDFKMVTLLRERTKLPIIVRGVTSGVDTMKAVASGATAVWVHSNTPGAASPISVLRNVVYTLRGNHMMTEVFFSGGIRRGTEVMKAIAIGANAVFLDEETPLWGLHHSG